MTPPRRAWKRLVADTEKEREWNSLSEFVGCDYDVAEMVAGVPPAARQQDQLHVSREPTGVPREGRRGTRVDRCRAAAHGRSRGCPIEEQQPRTQEAGLPAGWRQMKKLD